jgi:hypothetical protein
MARAQGVPVGGDLSRDCCKEHCIGALLADIGELRPAAGNERSVIPPIPTGKARLWFYRDYEPCETLV